MAGSAACWGLGTVASRDLLGSIPPLELLVVQLAASVAALLLICAIHGTWRAVDRRLARASLAGILEPGAAYAVGLLGLSRTTASHAAVIGATEPLVVVALFWLVLGMRPSRRLFGCLVVATLGLALVASPDLSRPAAGVTGDLLIGAATLLAALYVLASSRAAALPASALAAGQQSVGLVVAALLWCAFGSGRGFATLAADGWLAAGAALSGIVQYALAFGLYLTALQQLSASVAALWLAAIPVFGLAGAMALLGERPDPESLAGAGLIVGALVAARGER
jgi:drug/metabolite transporter (DMT)-like permease